MNRKKTSFLKTGTADWKRLTIFLATLLLACSFVLPAAAKEKVKEGLDRQKVTITVDESEYVIMASKKTAKWSVKNKKIASVTAKGNVASVTGKKKGTTTLTGRVGDHTYTCKIIVKNNPKLSKKKMQISVGESKKLKLLGTSSKAKWSTSDKSIVSLKKQKNKVYYLNAKKMGTATVTVKVNGKKLKCKVTVDSGIKKLKMKLSSNFVYTGDSFPKEAITVTGVFKDGTKREITDYTMSFKPRKTEGTSTLKITYDTLTLKKDIKVIKRPSKLVRLEAVSKKNNVDADYTFKTSDITVTAYYEDGTSKVLTEDEYKISKKKHTGSESYYLINISVGSIKADEIKITFKKEETPEAPKAVGIEASCKLTEVESGYKFQKTDFTVYTVYDDGTKEERKTSAFSMSYSSKSGEDFYTIKITAAAFPDDVITLKVKKK